MPITSPVDSIACPTAASITLSLLPADVQTQPVLTQEPSVSIASGESVTLKCVMSLAKFKDYCVDWYQQKSAKSGLKRGEGVPERFWGSKDHSLNEGYLNISLVQPEDEADYYCSIWDGLHEVHRVCYLPFLLTAGLVLTFSASGLGTGTKDAAGGCYAQVTQPPSELVSPGGNVQLPCTLEGSYTVSANRVVWIQQRPNSVPRYLLYFFTESNKGMGSGVPSRFAGSRSGSDKIGYLTITGAQAEDDAVYYCVTWTGTKSAPHVKDETQKGLSITPSGPL
uniref:Ig-like domain-containing protein n=1 Tax=Gopherus evgoodei TaxID=1825980 RepID=A0A8C4WQV2_9SAUR